jgi:hypothetical protein
MISEDIYKYINTKKLSWTQASVNNGNTKRFDKAEEQKQLNCVEIRQIINYTNDFLEIIGIKRVQNPL